MILTHNEAIHLSRALDSVASFARSVHVVDSGSGDGTVEIAKARGAEVLVHAWRNYADQFQWGMDNIDSDADWILRLDADEVIGADLAARFYSEVSQLPAEVAGINIDRRHVFMGRWIRFGGRYPLTLLRLFRRGQGRIEQRWMDEHIVLESGRTVHFAGSFSDVNLKDLSFFTAKHNGYATREAVDIINQRHGLFPRDMAVTAGSTSVQAGLKRFIKERVYNALPPELSALGYFLYRYLLQLGFLDGREGLIYHVLQGFWYRFLVGAKVVEYERELVHWQTRAAKLDRLTALTGLALTSPATPAAPAPVAPPHPSQDL
ncbi:MAG: glycosyltransferase family 2 protein [Candidatus Devosia phytovorans]|uniref:Glycosyltransferase family 2 protein n=1 Tax=Candidatus Devosia phytovorans TaxID=3121372 RepID=A0AAJ5VX47_9HYPH|nr:glycosyltransferase family 2 protein [Devosia sp.]WEK05686.1 MAG: glycosyltransferase family 2 protein [Devosia sp.]